jgi:hypothetical protein
LAWAKKSPGERSIGARVFKGMLHAWPLSRAVRSRRGH